jgi:anti-anti-sigma factor
MRNGVAEKRILNGLTLFTLVGELDVADAAALRRELAGSPDATVPDLAIDLRQVGFVDASIFGVLVMVYRRVISAGGCLRLVGARVDRLAYSTSAISRVCAVLPRFRRGGHHGRLWPARRGTRPDGLTGRIRVVARRPGGRAPSVAFARWLKGRPVTSELRHSIGLAATLSSRVLGNRWV